MSSEDGNKKSLERIILLEGLTIEETRALTDSLEHLDKTLDDISSGRCTEKSIVKKESVEQEIAKFSYHDRIAVIARLSEEDNPAAGLELYVQSLKKYDNVSTVLAGNTADIADIEKRKVVEITLEKYLKEDNRPKEIPRILHVKEYGLVGDALVEEGVFSILNEPGSIFDDSEPTIEAQSLDAPQPHEDTVEVSRLVKAPVKRKALVLGDAVLEAIMESTMMNNFVILYPNRRVPELLDSKAAFKYFVSKVKEHGDYDCLIINAEEKDKQGRQIEVSKALGLAKVLVKHTVPDGMNYFVLDKSKGTMKRETGFTQYSSDQDLLDRLDEYSKEDIERAKREGWKPMPAMFEQIEVPKKVVSTEYQDGSKDVPVMPESPEMLKSPEMPKPPKILKKPAEQKKPEKKKQMLPPPPQMPQIDVGRQFLRPPADTPERHLEQIVENEKDDLLEGMLKDQYDRAKVSLNEDHRLIAKALLEKYNDLGKKYNKKDMINVTNLVPILLMRYGETMKDGEKYGRWRDNFFKVLGVLADTPIEVPDTKEKNVYVISQLAEMLQERDDQWKDIKPLVEFGLSNYRSGGYSFINNSMEVIDNLVDIESLPFVSKMLFRTAEVDIEHAKLYVEQVLNEYSSKFMNPTNQRMYLYELCQACEKKDQGGNTAWNSLLPVAEDVFNREHFKEARKEEIDAHYEKEKMAAESAAARSAAVDAAFEKLAAPPIVLDQPKAYSDPESVKEPRPLTGPIRPAPAKEEDKETIDMMLDDSLEPESAVESARQVCIADEWGDQFGLADALAPAPVMPPEPTDATQGKLVQEQIGKTIPPREQFYAYGRGKEPAEAADDVLAMVPGQTAATHYNGDAAAQNPPPLPIRTEPTPAPQVTAREADQIVDLVYNGAKPAEQRPAETKDPDADYKEDNLRVRSMMFGETEKPAPAAVPDLDADIESAEEFTGDVEALLEMPEPAIPDEMPEPVQAQESEPMPAPPVQDYRSGPDDFNIPIDDLTEDAVMIDDPDSAVKPVPEGLEDTLFKPLYEGEDAAETPAEEPGVARMKLDLFKDDAQELVPEEVDEIGEEITCEHDDEPSSEEVIQMPEERPNQPSAPSPEQKGMSSGAKWVLGLGVPAAIALAAYIGAAMQANNDEKAVEDFNKKVIVQTLNSDECKKMQCAALYGNKQLKAAIDDRFLPDENVGDRSVDKEGLVKRMGLIKDYVAVFGMPQNESVAAYMVNGAEVDLEGKIAVGKEALKYRAQRGKQSVAREQGLKQVQKIPKKGYAKIWVPESRKPKRSDYQTRNQGILDTRAAKQYKRSL